METTYREYVFLQNRLQAVDATPPFNVDEDILTLFFENLNISGGVNVPQVLALKPEICTLLGTYIAPRFYNQVIYSYISIEDENGSKVYSDQDEIATGWEGRVFSWLMSSYERYKALLDAYATKKETLLEDINTSTEQRTNETPQPNNAGDYEDLNYENLYVRANSRSSGGTPAQRLKDIEDNISNVYKNWADEFKQFIGYPN